MKKILDSSEKFSDIFLIEKIVMVIQIFHLE